MNSTESLVKRVRQGDEAAFKSIFERYARPLISFLYDQVGERELAEELTQETFVRAYRNINLLRDDGKLSTWLFGIAKNVARESLRSQRSRRFELEIDNPLVANLRADEEPLDCQIVQKELNRQVRDALQGLDSDKRIVFTLRVMQDKSYEEIATITGFSLGKVKTDLHRARAEMRRAIGAYLETAK